MILEREDAIYAAGVFEDYFKNFGRIDEYMKGIKTERMDALTPTLPGMGFDTMIFNDFTINPKDMEFEIYENQEEYKTLLNVTASHMVEDSIPGKTIKLIVKEKNTGGVVGFIRFGSPTINSKPRNEFLGTTPDLAIFNKRVIMGFIIVPTQPFGFNYLGGKLLSLLAVSKPLRQMLNDKYDCELCMFETTSLYGDIKGCSQYDGLKPFLRYKGLTDSKFAPLLHDEVFRDLNKFFVDKTNGFIPRKTDQRQESSYKLKASGRMVGVIKASFKKHGMPEAHQAFTKVMTDAIDLTTRKRTYFSDYGFSNVKEVLLGQETELKKGQNYDKYDLDYLIPWWKNKAQKRFDNLKDQDRLRTEVEIWNEGTDIDIIR
jgi:hypothetical protein